MNMHPIGEAGEMMIDAEDPRTLALRRMSAEQLLHLGARQVVYLKSRVCDDEVTFVLYGANGIPLAAVDAIETAVEMVSERGLDFVTVH
jgi:hypothetical protein